MGIEFEIDFFTTTDGETPALEAFAEFEVVSPKLRDATLAYLERLQYKNMHTGVLIKKIAPNLWYLRIHQGSNRARLFFTFQSNAKILLLNGFIKKTAKIPKADLQRALNLLKEVAYAQ